MTKEDFKEMQERVVLLELPAGAGGPSMTTPKQHAEVCITIPLPPLENMRGYRSSMWTIRLEFHLLEHLTTPYYIKWYHRLDPWRWLYWRKYWKAVDWIEEARP